MNVEKMDGKTADIVGNNIEKLKELFPEIFAEGKIDFDALKTELGETIEDKEERYSFSWNGKQDAKKIALLQSKGTLRPVPEDSVDFDTTENLFIEGDNLEVLRILQSSYRGRVKMIYIDPPYNTGKDFVYKDNFTSNIANYKEQMGTTLQGNPETNGRYHTDWLNMMFPRLKLAKNLLKDDGVIFISIDDNEVTNLRKICDEVFGEDNVEVLIWNKEAEGSSGTLKQTATVRRVHEYVICAYRDYRLVQFKKVNEALLGREGEFQTANLAINIENERLGHANYFTITNPSGEKFTRQWKWSEHEINKLIKENLIYWGSDGHKQPRLIIPTDERRTTYLLSILNYGGTTVGRKDFETIMGEEVDFSYPKPLLLLKKLINTASESESVILDFFAGSATTAQATIQLNAEDGGNRKFIMVQIPELTPEDSEARKAGYDTISEIAKERIRRAGNKIKEDFKDKLTSREKPLDTGFKVFRLDETGLKEWDDEMKDMEKSLFDYADSLKEGRTVEDILYEIMLKDGIELTEKIETIEIGGGKAYSIAGNHYTICLMKSVTKEIVEGVVNLHPKPSRVVFLDSAFGENGSALKINAEQIFKKAGVENFVVI